MKMDTSSYYDFTALAALKNTNSSKGDDAPKAVLKKFESLFIDQMLQAMRKATFKSGLFESNGMKTYESMFDKEISEELARAGGLGLTKSLEQQLGLDGQSPEERKERSKADDGWTIRLEKTSSRTQSAKKSAIEKEKRKRSVAPNSLVFARYRSTLCALLFVTRLQSFLFSSVVVAFYE